MKSFRFNGLLNETTLSQVHFIANVVYCQSNHAWYAYTLSAEAADSRDVWIYTKGLRNM